MKCNTSIAIGIFALLGSFLMIPSVAAQNYDWTGFYVGAQAGFAKPKDKVFYGGSSIGIPFDAVDQRITHRENSFAGGMQGGYNHQLGWFVPGIEADLGYLVFNGHRVSPAEFDPQHQTYAVSTGGLFGTVTGRLGVSIDRVLLYTKAGFAYTNLRLGVEDRVPPLTTDASKRSTYPGWTLGGGIEYSITQNWLIKSEYQFMDFAQKSISAVASDGVTDTWKHRPSAHIIKLGFNYKF
jgi:outer membrane immunogenic protein